MPTRLTAGHLAPTRCILGEGPLWHDRRLHIVDIHAPAVHRMRFDHNWLLVEHERVELSTKVGAVLPRRDGVLVAALMARGLVELGPDLREGELWVEPEPGKPENRYNDGKVDPAGRVFIGTMATDQTPGAGTLYRVDHDGSVTRVIEGVTISNGLGWSPDGRTMYYIDSPTRRVDALDYDVATGSVSNRRTFVEIADGFPDGMCVDPSGGVWVAHWAGGRATRFDPQTGEATHVVGVPAQNVTSCCVVGGMLVLTTARDDVNERAGDVFGSRLDGV
jgi:sugar lactone lactonase YvrE